MDTGTITDIAVAVILISSLIAGWRHGAFAAVLSTIGVIAGIVCGAGIAPLLAGSTDNPGLKLLLVLGSLVLLMVIGHMTGSYLGASLRDRMRMKTSQRIDSIIGAAFHTLTTTIVLWLIANPLAASHIPVLNTAISSSRILSAVDHHMPPVLGQLPSKTAALLSESGLPPLISPFTNHTGTEVAAPAIKVDDKELVDALRPSVVHVLGDANQCSRRLSGTGFVTSEDHIITNAHVVAGTNLVTIDTTHGTKEATVVYYNPNEDIAVLYTPNLNLQPLTWAPEPAATGDDTIVMGYPDSGPFEAAPGRVKDKLTVNGPDIYATTRTNRQAYTVRGTIRQGNSGGPMVNLQGQVLGVVFGAAIDKSDTGFVLTADEVKNTIGDATTRTTAVDTGKCVNGHTPTSDT